MYRFENPPPPEGEDDVIPDISFYKPHGSILIKMLSEQNFVSLVDYLDPDCFKTPPTSEDEFSDDEITIVDEIPFKGVSNVEERPTNDRVNQEEAVKEKSTALFLTQDEEIVAESQTVTIVCEEQTALDSEVVEKSKIPLMKDTEKLTEEIITIVCEEQTVLDSEVFEKSKTPLTKDTENLAEASQIITIDENHENETSTERTCIVPQNIEEIDLASEDSQTNLGNEKKRLKENNSVMAQNPEEIVLYSDDSRTSSKLGEKNENTEAICVKALSPRRQQINSSIEQLLNWRRRDSIDEHTSKYDKLLSESLHKERDQSKGCDDSSATKKTNTLFKGYKRRFRRYRSPEVSPENSRIRQIHSPRSPQNSLPRAHHPLPHEQRHRSSREQRNFSPHERRLSSPYERRLPLPYENRHSPPYERCLSSPFERRQCSPFERRQSSAFERRQSSPFERRQSSPFERRQSSPFERRQSSPFERRQSLSHELLRSSSRERHPSLSHDRHPFSSRELQHFFSPIRHHSPSELRHHSPLAWRPCSPQHVEFEKPRQRKRTTERYTNPEEEYKKKRRKIIHYIDENSDQDFELSEIKISSKVVKKTSTCQETSEKSKDVIADDPESSKKDDSNSEKSDIKTIAFENYYCKDCQITLNSKLTWESHIVGKKHKKAIQCQAIHEIAKGSIRVPPNPDFASLDKPRFLIPAAGKKLVPLKDRSRLQKTVDEETRYPMPGLNHVIEIRSENVITYYCRLCDAPCQPVSIMPHLIGFNHQLLCLKEIDEVFYEDAKNVTRRKSITRKMLAVLFNHEERHRKGRIRVYEEIPDPDAVLNPIETLYFDRPGPSWGNLSIKAEGDEFSDSGVLSNDEYLDTSKSDFYCTLCDSHMNNFNMWASHIRGKRHLKNAKKVPGEKVSKQKSVKAPPHVASKLESMLREEAKGEVIVGLSFIRETQSKNGEIYNCFLCCACATNYDIIDHILLTKHRTKYLEKLYTDGIRNGINAIANMDINNVYIRDNLIKGECIDMIEKYGKGKVEVYISKDME